ncbi:aspartate-semialdehyde dehydrogenase [Alphaproteobacteria bacterium]|nr:aspartate-semialdehyde dehydrogenase [Alphaproteobacteria bacterium]GHS99899.1 aspartate-semialdehyde dehydrogenase [Alphaproteobacteria bacterium]
MRRKSLSEVTIAIVGATGNVGLAFLKILEERCVPFENITALASAQSAGKILAYQGKSLPVHNLETFDFSHTDIGLFSPGAAVSAVYAPKAAAQGCLVMDNTSYFRMDPAIPLIVPEINAAALLRDTEPRRRRDAGRSWGGIIANPNCSTIQMVMALHPIDLISPLQRVSVATYQSVSGGGKGAVDELYAQTAGDPTVAHLPKTMAYNVIPQIDVFLEDGQTKEEWKMVAETQKILGKPLKISATCVRVPVVCGHSEAIHFELADDVPLETLRQALRAFPGVRVADSFATYDTPLDIAGSDDVFVSRLRKDAAIENGYQMWVVADNVRKGAALNAVQIAETFLALGLKK